MYLARVLFLYAVYDNDNTCILLKVLLIYSQTSHTELFSMMTTISHCFAVLNFIFVFQLFIWVIWLDGGVGWGRVAASAGRRRQSPQPLSPAPPMES